MRIAIPRLRLWHLLGLVAAGAAFLAVFRYRWEVEDPGYRWARRLGSAHAAERAEAAHHLGAIRPPERGAIGPLIEALSDGDARVRAGAAGALGNIFGGGKDDPEARAVGAALAAALGDRDRGARRAIAEALAVFRPEPRVIVPALLEFARDGEPAVRLRTINLLGLFARESEPARDAVVAALDDADEFVRSMAVNSLGWCLMIPGLAPEPILGTVKAALLRAADDGDAQVRRAAIRTLGGLGGRTRTEIPRVIEALTDPDAEVRLVAATYLATGRPGARSAALIPALVRTLADPDPRVRKGSAATLGRLGLDAEAALPALRAVPSFQDEADRGAIAGAVRAIEGAAETFRSHTLPGAIADLGDAEPVNRSLAADRLGDFGPRSAGAVPALARCLGDREVIVRRAAARALGLVGPSALAALPALAERADSDDDEGVRRSAALSRSALLHAAAGGPGEIDRPTSRGGPGR